ncbi:MAG: hypothetical protein HZA59_11505 [Hydrogenophilales bacterium]|nr:hypothetical protein [Hydrogenophilales bacterium]
MNLATLRVSGTDAALDTIKKTLSLDLDTQWRKGDIRRNGRKQESSGFNSTIADAENPIELLRLIRIFLAQCKEKAVVFSQFKLEAELDIGFSVGDSKQFFASVEFSPSELLSFAESDLLLRVSAYPTSDEANADEETA